MHELSVAQALLDTVDRWQKENGGNVLSLRVEIGRLAGVDPEALAYAWPMALGASENVHLRGCRLETEMLPLEFSCTACGRRVLSEKLVMICPACGCERMRHLSGRELRLKDIEVEHV